MAGKAEEYMLYSSRPNTNSIVLDHRRGIRRHAVSIEWLYNHPDIDAWIYNKEKEELGLDPWTKISGIDKSTKLANTYYLQWGSTGERIVKGHHVLYISEKDYKELHGE